MQPVCVGEKALNGLFCSDLPDAKKKSIDECGPAISSESKTLRTSHRIDSILPSIPIKA
jgi:hypothetical protein